jgi:hypothetical protein
MFLEWQARLIRTAEGSILDRVKRMEIYLADIPKASDWQDFLDRLGFFPISHQFPNSYLFPNAL